MVGRVGAKPQPGVSHSVGGQAGLDSVSKSPTAQASSPSCLVSWDSGFEGKPTGVPCVVFRFMIKRTLSKKDCRELGKQGSVPGSLLASSSGSPWQPGAVVLVCHGCGHSRAPAFQRECRAALGTWSCSPGPTAVFSSLPQMSPGSRSFHLRLLETYLACQPFLGHKSPPSPPVPSTLLPVTLCPCHRSMGTLYTPLRFPSTARPSS